MNKVLGCGSGIYWEFSMNFLVLLRPIKPCICLEAVKGVVMEASFAFQPASKIWIINPSYFFHCDATQQYRYLLCATIDAYPRSGEPLKKKEKLLVIQEVVPINLACLRLVR